MSSSNDSSSSTSGLSGFLAAFQIMLVVSMIVSISSSVRDSKKAKKFDDQIDTGSIVIAGNKIPLLQDGIPLHVELPAEVEIPPGSEALRDHPRVYTLSSGCTSLGLPENTAYIMAAAEFSSSEFVQIGMPRLDSGEVQVCIDEPIELDVVLWAIVE